ncbi:unnamed protein product [Orchesella dallaii]|uniref:C2H2-type domain-containing protein n=1 Tax=Orchesella dallaii TaxID=48710 RepID=A0ABP1PU68_9HEXA
MYSYRIHKSDVVSCPELSSSRSGCQRSNLTSKYNGTIHYTRVMGRVNGMLVCRATRKLPPRLANEKRTKLMEEGIKREEKVAGSNDKDKVKPATVIRNGVRVQPFQLGNNSDIIYYKDEESIHKADKGQPKEVTIWTCGVCSKIFISDEASRNHFKDSHSDLSLP